MPSHRAQRTSNEPGRRSGRRRAAAPKPGVVETLRAAVVPAWTRWALQHLPRVSVIGVLGVATIAVPLTTWQQQVEPQAAAAAVAAPALSTGTGTVVPQLAAQAVPQSLARSADVRPYGDLVEVSRSAERPALEGCDAQVSAASRTNGKIPVDDLCPLWNGEDSLRADAAVAATSLNDAFRARFGTDLCVSDGYRSYAEQVAVRSAKPGLAAVPGSSQHGWGLAMDLCGGIQTASGEAWDWLSVNGPIFGWENPDWARRGGSGAYEPWHWEFVVGQQADASLGLED